MRTPATQQKLAYTISEAAALLSLSRSLVYELINAGQIDTIKIGRARRITANQLRAYVTKREEESSPGMPLRRL